MTKYMRRSREGRKDGRTGRRLCSWKAKSKSSPTHYYTNPTLAYWYPSVSSSSFSLSWGLNHATAAWPLRSWCWPLRRHRSRWHKEWWTRRMRKITHLSLWCSQITDELVALHIRNLLDPVMGAHKFRWLWHYFRENLQIYLKRATDEDGGILIKTSSSSSSWPQERRRGGGSSTWIKLRIASHRISVP